MQQPPPDTDPKGWHARGYLPHLDAAQVLQFVTFRLADAVPAQVIDRWQDELKSLTDRDEAAAVLRRRIEHYADAGHGACHLRELRIASLVRDALTHFDGRRYSLLAWCIMPNHVHVLIALAAQAPSLRSIVHSWKSYTAKAANRRLGRNGAFWQRDYFDRYVRDDAHLQACVEYIRDNPVKAGLVRKASDWPWCGEAPAVSAGVPPVD